MARKFKTMDGNTAAAHVSCADAIGTGTADAAEQTARCEAALSLLTQAEKGCSSVSTLAVSGRDLLARGMTQGPAAPTRPSCRRSRICSEPLCAKWAASMSL